MSSACTLPSCDGRVTVATHASVAPLPPRVVACLLTTAVPNAASLAIARHATVRPFADRRALVAYARGQPLAAIVVDLRDADGRPTTGTVRSLRTVAPSLAVFARCRLASPDCDLLLDFARAGGRGVLLDGNWDPLIALLASPHAESSIRAMVAKVTARLVAAGVSSALVPTLDAFMRHLDHPDATRAAAALGVTRRALERRLAQAGLPSPRTLHTWCRMLVSAERLAAGGASVERVAHEVGFPSANALRNALRRYGDATPSAMRDGGVERLVTRFSLACVRGASRDAALSRCTSSCRGA